MVFKPPRGSILRLWRAPSLRGCSAGRSFVTPSLLLRFGVRGACCSLIVCERGGAGSEGSAGSAGVVRRKNNEAPQNFDSASCCRHRKRCRESFFALRSVSHKNWQGNDALVLRISAFTHASFIGLQERFLASLEMTIRESDVSQSPSHQSLVTSCKQKAPPQKRRRLFSCRGGRVSGSCRWRFSEVRPWG